MANPPPLKKLKVPELKEILKCRGIPHTDKNKPELLELSEKAVKHYEPLESCDHDQSEFDRRQVIKRDGKKVNLFGRSVKWTLELKSMPTLTLSNIFRYLVKKSKWTSERLADYTSDNGYKLFVAGNVERVELGTISKHQDHVYIKGSVKPAQRWSDDRYDSWILVSTLSFIESAGCGCVAA